MNPEGIFIPPSFFSDMLLLALLLSVSISVIPLLIILIRNPILKRKKMGILAYFRKIRFVYILSFFISLVVTSTAMIILYIIDRTRFGGSFDVTDLLKEYFLVPYGAFLLTFFGYQFLMFVGSNLFFRKELKAFRLAKKAEINTVLDEQNNSLP